MSLPSSDSTQALESSDSTIMEKFFNKLSTGTTTGVKFIRSPSTSTPPFGPHNLHISGVITSATTHVDQNYYVVDDHGLHMVDHDGDLIAHHPKCQEHPLFPDIKCENFSLLDTVLFYTVILLMMLQLCGFLWIVTKIKEHSKTKEGLKKNGGAKSKGAGKGKNQKKKKINLNKTKSFPKGPIELQNLAMKFMKTGTIQIDEADVEDNITSEEELDQDYEHEDVLDEDGNVIDIENQITEAEENLLNHHYGSTSTGAAGNHDVVIHFDEHGRLINANQVTSEDINPYNQSYHYGTESEGHTDIEVNISNLTVTAKDNHNLDLDSESESMNFQERERQLQIQNLERIQMQNLEKRKQAMMFTTQMQRVLSPIASLGSFENNVSDVVSSGTESDGQNSGNKFGATRFLAGIMGQKHQGNSINGSAKKLNSESNVDNNSKNPINMTNEFVPNPPVTVRRSDINKYSNNNSLRGSRASRTSVTSNIANHPADPNVPMRTSMNLAANRRLSEFV